ncbi:hypothetical protein MTO96_015734 [Rhipicephalus appendiculatus]
MLGSWDPANDRVLKRLCSGRYLRLFNKLAVSETIAASLDLVTLDNLSPEAMLESSQRVENLVERSSVNEPPTEHPYSSASLQARITSRVERRYGIPGEARPSRLGFVVVFLLGTTPDQEVQRKVLAEHETYGDIVQGDFVDSYKNLTYKSAMLIRWAREKC